ncbi:MAG: DUF2892 domain-containing protein [Nitrospirae bacterium]|nr:DUF2892 domain-containing protein [Nitrospirota bacterium]
MTCNLGNVERVIRTVLGVILIGVGYFAGLPTVGAIVAYLVGAVAILTAAVGFCPAWKLFGINTCPTKTAAKG